MRARLLSWWDSVRTSFWFVPALMVVAAIGISLAMIELDQLTGDHVMQNRQWVWSGGPEGARGLLSTIAGSMITVAGVVFSITIVSLTLASSQFGPRLLRNFISDKGNQLVLGTFVATFVYCLLVLRTVRGVGGVEFVPHVSTTFALVLALVNIGVLIYFIHHVATMIQAPYIIALVARDLDQSIDHMFPEQLGQSKAEPQGHTAEPEMPDDFARRARAVRANQEGYLQVIDADGLMRLAVQHDLLIVLRYRPDSFIVQGSEIMDVWPPERASPAVTSQLSETFIVGPTRTPMQDVEFAVRQLVEIAVRALSPGINDPLTAMTCIDRLGAALCRLAEREIPSPYRYDTEGTLRVVADAVTFKGVTDAAFNQIRQYGRSSAAVAIRLLEMFAVVGARVHRKEDQVALRRQALMVKRGSETALPEEEDRKEVAQRYQTVLHVLLDDDALESDTIKRTTIQKEHV
ncbi:MAG: DUF2254 domain-containing protein [Candidatus Binatia bacterium]